MEAGVGSSGREIQGGKCRWEHAVGEEKRESLRRRLLSLGHCSYPRPQRAARRWGMVDGRGSWRRPAPASPFPPAASQARWAPSAHAWMTGRQSAAPRRIQTLAVLRRAKWGTQVESKMSPSASAAAAPGGAAARGHGRTRERRKKTSCHTSQRGCRWWLAPQRAQPRRGVRRCMFVCATG